MIRRLLFCSMLLLAMSGCAAIPPNKAEIEKLDYGAPLTIDYEKSIKDSLEKVLFDPYSAQYKFESPQRYWYRGYSLPLSRGQLHAGYLVIVWVNAKNRFGAYTGMEKYRFLFRNNEVIKVWEHEGFEYAGSPD